MKRIWMGLLAVLMFLGCVPTPNEEVVINKADGNLENIIHATAAPTDALLLTPTAPGEAPASAEPGARAMQTVDWTDSFSVAAAMDQLDVTIDAKVSVPAVDAAAVLRIGFAPPSDAQMQTLIRTFLGERAVYQADTTRTKAFYMAQMNRYLAEKEKETLDANLKEWDRLLAAANENYAKAPDTQSPAVWDGQTSGGVDLMSVKEDGTFRYLKANEVKLVYQDAVDTPYIIRPSKMKHEPETDAEAAAVNLCEETLQALGIDAVLSELCTTESAVKEFGARRIDGYLICFSPLYRGLPVTDPKRFNGFDEAISAAGGSVDTTGYTVRYEPETIEFIVENEAVVSFRYMRPSRVLRVENESARLLPFGEIRERFRKDIGKVMFVNKGQPMKLCVHTVRLTMQRCPIQNTTDELYLLPCWEFLASVDSGNPGTDEYLQNVCVLRLNALDGSIMN